MKEHKELLQKWLRLLFYIQIASMTIVVVNAVSNLDSITVWVNRGLTDTITTVLIALSTILGLSIEGLYLYYLKRTLVLLET